MSQSSRIVVNMAQPFTPLADLASLEESFDGDESSFLEDLLNSPEFIEEQKVILLEIETARLRIAEDEQSTSSPERQNVDRRPRQRRTIGMRLTCPICLENLASVRTCYVKMVTQCGHVFCQDCIENVCENTRRLNVDDDPGVRTLCPVCREEIGELRKVYF